MLRQRLLLSSSSSCSLLLPSLACFQYHSQRCIATSSSIQSPSSSSLVENEQQQKQLSGLDPPFTPIYKDGRSKTKSSASSSYFRVCCRGCNQQIFDSDVILKGNPGWPTFHSVSYRDKMMATETKNRSNTDAAAATNPSTLTRDVLNLIVDDLTTIAEDNHDYLLQQQSRRGDEDNTENTKKNNATSEDENNEEEEITASIPLTEEEKLLQQALDVSRNNIAPKRNSFTSKNNKNKDNSNTTSDQSSSSSSSSSSLILRSSPPTMRWGISAIKPTNYNHEIMSPTEKFFLRIQERKKERKLNKKSSLERRQVRESVEVKHSVKDISRDTPGVCRGFCQNCDTFIGFVFSNEPKSPSKQRFVCSPSSLVFRD